MPARRKTNEAITDPVAPTSEVEGPAVGDTRKLACGDKQVFNGTDWKTFSPAKPPPRVPPNMSRNESIAEHRRNRARYGKAQKKD